MNTFTNSQRMRASMFSKSWNGRSNSLNWAGALYSISTLNNTKIIKFGWVILNLCPLLEIQSYSRDKPPIRCFVEAHWAMFILLPRINGRPPPPQKKKKKKKKMEGFPGTIFRSSVAKNQAKFENDCISRSGHRFKITQPNLLILVSFSSAVCGRCFI